MVYMMIGMCTITERHTETQSDSWEIQNQWEIVGNSN